MVKNGGEHEGLGRGRGLELDGRTQEFHLGTPRLRADLEDPSTPEMPDLSSITQDICKVCKIICNRVRPVFLGDYVFYLAACVSGSAQEDGHDGRPARHPHR